MIATLRLELHCDVLWGVEAKTYWVVTVSGHAGTQGDTLELACVHAEEMARALLEVPDAYTMQSVRSRITGDVIENDVVFLPTGPA